MIGSPPATRQQLMGRIIGTSSVTSLVAVVADAYRVTLGFKRDLAALEVQREMAVEREQAIHKEVMAALAGRFKERAKQVAFVERVAQHLIEREEFEIAHSIITQMMTILQQSPVEEAFARRPRD